MENEGTKIFSLKISLDTFLSIFIIEMKRKLLDKLYIILMFLNIYKSNQRNE